VQGYLLKRLACGGDKVLFASAARTAGGYSIEITVEEVTSLVATAGGGARL
jgi:hypothetical protein